MSKTFPETFADGLTQAMGDGEFAFVASLDSGEIAGAVHAVGHPGLPGEADYDITIRTDLKGGGLGWRLMLEMLAEATRSGFRNVNGDVMLGNRAMLLLADDLGFRRVGTEAGDVRIVAVPPQRHEPRPMTPRVETRLVSLPAA